MRTWKSLEKIKREHEARVRRIDRIERILFIVVIISGTIGLLTPFLIAYLRRHG